MADIPKMTDNPKAAAWITGVLGIIGVVFTGLVSVFVTLHLERSKVSQAVGLASVVATGMYEWQWAGSGWKGYLTVEQNGYAHLELHQFMKCGGAEKLISILKQEGDGKAIASEDGTELTVNIPVRFATTVDSDCNVKGLGDVVTLHGTLSRKVAFAGPIQYQTQGNSSIGDMVLVRDFQSGPH